MLVGLAILAVVLFLAAPGRDVVITPGFEPAQLDRTVGLTRIMLLSPILLAMGSVARACSTRGGRFAAVGDRPDGLQPRDHRRGAVLLAPRRASRGLAVGVVAGSLGHLLVQLRPLRGGGFRYRAASMDTTTRGREALVLMAPRALGLGAARSRSSSSRPWRRPVHRGHHCLQRRVHAAPDPDRRDRRAARGRAAAVALAGGRRRREVEFARLLTRALRLILYAMIPIAASRGSSAWKTVEILFGRGRSGRSTSIRSRRRCSGFLTGLAAHALIAVLARAFYARQDTETPVIAGIAAVVINATLGGRPAWSHGPERDRPGHRPRPLGSRPSSCSASCAFDHGLRLGDVVRSGFKPWLGR